MENLNKDANDIASYCTESPIEYDLQLSSPSNTVERAQTQLNLLGGHISEI